MGLEITFLVNAEVDNFPCVIIQLLFKLLPLFCEFVGKFHVSNVLQKFLLGGSETFDHSFCFTRLCSKDDRPFIDLLDVLIHLVDLLQVDFVLRISLWHLIF